MRNKGLKTKAMRVSTFTLLLSALGKRALRTCVGLSSILGLFRHRLSGARGTSDGFSYESSVHGSKFGVNGTFVLLSALILLALPAFGQVPVNVGPEPQTQFLSTTGAPLSGGIVCTYAAGTSTPQATYTDSTGSVQNTNPIVLNSAGRANIWWQAPAYKVVLAAGGTCASPSGLQWSVDNFSIGVFAAGNTTFTGNNTFNGTSTFNGAVTITNGGTFNGTFAGNPTFSGTVTFTGSLSVSQLQLTVATGTPPLVVTSTTVVPNLNVEVINGVAYPASPSLHSVPVITATDTATYKVIPDCPSLVLQFTQATNAFSCGSFPASTIPTVVSKAGSNAGDYTTTSVSLTNVDGTNLSYTVVIPNGSKLLVWASGSMGFSASNSAGLLVAITDSAVVTEHSVEFSTGGSPAAIPFALNCVINGDGLSHTVKLQWATPSLPGGGTGILRNSSSNVPTMTFILTQSN